MDSANRLSNPRENDHIILVYENDQDRDSAISQYINEGLKRNQLCVYASVHVREEGHLKQIASRIENYELSISQGNLLILDLAPLYIAAMSEDLRPFDDISKMLIEKAKSRTNKHIRLVGDCVAFLFKNKHFEECLALEGWWQQKPFVGSYMCPFPKSMFNSYPFVNYRDSLLSIKHDLAIDTEGRVLATASSAPASNSRFAGEGKRE